MVRIGLQEEVRISRLLSGKIYRSQLKEQMCNHSLVGAEYAEYARAMSSQFRTS